MPNETEDVEVVEIISPLQIYQQDKANIDIQISTAHAYPRVIKRCIEDAIAIVTLNDEIAGKCNYSVPRGGKTIKGPSVHLAKIIAQCWGNMRIDTKVIGIDSKHVTSQSTCFDLQKNLAVRVEVKKLIVGRDGSRFSDDMITITGNAANSIALRNAVFAVVQPDCIDTIYNAAKKKITGDLSDEIKLKNARKKSFDSLMASYKVTEAEILTAIGKQTIDHINADDIHTLVGIENSIRDGDSTVDQIFRNGKKFEQPVDRAAKGEERLLSLIAGCKNLEDLEKHKQHCKTPKTSSAFDEKYKQLKEKK